MKTLCVIQHTSAEYLGLIEDHLEARGIRFAYFRPFTQGGVLPHRDMLGDGLVFLGGGPWGSAGTRDVPGLKDEIALARAGLMLEKPVIGFGLGAQILTLAADGKTAVRPLRLEVGTATRVTPDALGGRLPERFTQAIYMRDHALPPSYAEVLARDSNGDMAVFQIGKRAFGFAGNPGFKPAIAEDLVMEFEEAPADCAGGLQALREHKRDIEDALVPIMAGLIAATGLM